MAIPLFSGIVEQFANLSRSRARHTQCTTALALSKRDDACSYPPMAIQDQRLQATARHLESEGLDALVAVNFGQNNFLESHAVFVLSGVRPVGESAVVVERSGRSTLIVTPAWDGERAAA